MDVGSVESRFRAAVIDALLSVQGDGTVSVPRISDLTVPADDLEGFDSLRGIEVAAEISSSLGIEVNEIEYCDPKFGKLRTVGEIVASLVKRYGAQLTANEAVTDRDHKPTVS